MSTEIREIFESMEYGPAPESAGEALAWIAEHSAGAPFGNYIGGEWIASRSQGVFDTINPATGVTLASVCQAGAEEIDLAAKAARTAQPGWWAIGPHQRSRYMYALARHIQKHSRLLSVLETLDNGKTIRETRDIDIPLVARHFYHHAGWAQLMETELPDCEPVGVVGQIIPWNFPLLMLAWKIAPALATGNTVVLKPAENTPLTAIAFAHICAGVGIPPGVVNIVHGDGGAGELIVNHPHIDKIAFTGSTEVGRAIRRATAGSGKRLSLELGGKSPFIVFDDADLDSAVEGLVDAIWFNQGQVCCAGSRLLMQENIAQRLEAKIKARMKTLRVGDPLDKANDVGAIVSQIQLDRITSMVEAGAAEGAEVWQDCACCPPPRIAERGGISPKIGGQGGLDSGCFYPPTLITGVSPASTLAQEEIFGPVLVAMTFRTPSEAVELANNTRYGLAASVWTENINLALDIAPKLKAGVVWINSTNLFDAGSGFGGYRESGFGREGGREGLWEYVRAKGRGNREEGTEEKGQETGVRGQDKAFLSPPQERLGEGVNSETGRLSDGEMGRQETGTETGPSEQRTPNTQHRVDRTAKLFIGGKQVRPDSGYSIAILNPAGQTIAEVGSGNRKDIRNPVEAARAAFAWAAATAHLRAQILYYIAENLETRADEFAHRITVQTGASDAEAADEVQASIERMFTFAALADKYEGAVHPTPFRNITLAMPEPMGVIGIASPGSHPLLGFVATVIPAIAMGNTVVAIPSQTHPLSATDLYQVLETSDMPAGVVNIVTGARDTLIETLAGHDEVTAVWYWGPHEGAARVETLSAGNMKRTWVHVREGERGGGGEEESARLMADRAGIQEILREATQVKNIWVPYGE